MSCCGGNCGCGANCGCGSGCKGCGHSIPDLSFGEKTVEAQFFAATASDNGFFDDSVTVAGENGSGCGCASGGCKCGDNCTCDPCNCK